MVKGSYNHPYQMHGSLGSSCAVADVKGTGDTATATIWSSTQGVFLPREETARVLGWQDVGQVEELDLAAAQQHRNVRLNLDHRPPRERIVLEPAWRTRELTLTLREPRPGRVYDTLICISEVVVWIE